MRKSAAGFTLVEVLVALGVLSVMLYVTADVVGALQQNPVSEQRLQINRAAGSYLEQSVNTWRKPEHYGNLTLLPAPRSVAGTTVRTRACTVDPESQAAACGPYAAPGTATTYAGNAVTVTSGVRLVRLDVQYTPAGKAGITTALEIARR